MVKDDYHSKMLTIGIWITGITAAGFMIADVVVKPPVVWLTLMPVYCLAAFALLHGLSFLGVKRAFWFLALGLILPYVAEYLGTNFGAVFGSHWFARAHDLRLAVGVTLPGRVPLGIVLTWYGMLYLTFLVATYLVRSRPSEASSFGAVPLTAGLLMAFWQLSAGPAAVTRGMMGFTQSGFYHGIPLASFIGWFATSLFVLLFFQVMEPEAADSTRFARKKQTGPLALGMFGLALLHSTALCFRMNLWGAAWLGVVVLLLAALAFAVRSKSPQPVVRMREVPSPSI